MPSKNPEGYSDRNAEGISATGRLAKDASWTDTDPEVASGEIICLVVACIGLLCNAISRIDSVLRCGFVSHALSTRDSD